MARSLDIDLLKTFHAVAHLGQFKAAAAHLGKSTSAVSVHIQRIEEIAGTQLLERDNQGVILTPRGRQFIAESVAFLAEHDRLLSALTAVPVSGKVRLGVPEEYAGRFLRELLPLFTREHPAIELEVEAASSETLTARLEKKRLDAAVTVVDERAGSSDGAIASVHPVWVAGNDMRALSAKVLPVAVHATGCPYREVAIAALESCERPWRCVLTSGSSSAIATAVESGLAVALMDRSRLPDGLSAIPSSFGLPALPRFRVVYSGHGSSNAELCLRDAIIRFFAD
jgi:DNA-binding transcriptional LysR family regulator